MMYLMAHADGTIAASGHAGDAAAAQIQCAFLASRLGAGLTAWTGEDLGPIDNIRVAIDLASHTLQLKPGDPGDAGALPACLGAPLTVLALA